MVLGKGKYIALTGIITVMLFSGCDKILPKKKKELPPPAPLVKEVKGTVIARVNNQPLTLEELNAEIEAFNSGVPEDKPEEKIDTRDKKIAYLKNEMIRRVIFAQAAADRGLDRKEEIQKALENYKQGMLVAELVKEETANVEVTSSEIEDFYNRSKETLKEPEERRVREILLSSESDARSVLIELLQGADFATVAQGRSIASSAKNGGDLGFIQKDKAKKSPQFDTEAFSTTLEVGKISNYFKAPEGYYILKLEAKREGKVKSLSELWDDIKNGLTFLKQQQKIEALIGKLSQDAKIEVIESVIK